MTSWNIFVQLGVYFLMVDIGCASLLPERPTELHNDDIAMLVEKMDVMQTKLDDMDTMKAKMDRLETSEVAMKQRIEELESQLKRYEAMDVNAGSQNVAYQQEDELHNKKAPQIRQAHRQIVPEQVAFTAYLDHVIRDLGKNQPVVYNKVLLNDGNAYSNSTGIFRVPTTGVYLFSWSVTARKLSGEHNYDVWVKLLVNGNHQTGAVAESRDVADDNQGSNSVVLRCNQGDEVWTSHYSSFPDMFGDDNERTTSFMGVLLYMTE